MTGSAAGTTIASIVIPAHNEESVLPRCIDTVLADAAPGEFEVFVVANGCTDRTAQVANAYRHRGVRVISIDVASKPAALNAGDAAATILPRVFLDADVRVDTAAVRELVRVLGSRPGGPLAAAPRLRIERRRSSRWASTYLGVLESLPVFAQGYVGSGCFALSSVGRARFQHFPDVIADDRFVNLQFAPHEKHTTPDHVVLAVGPRTLRGIIRRSVRVQAGTLALDSQLAGSQTMAPSDSGSSGSTRKFLLRRARRPRELAGVLLFVTVQVAIDLIARLRMRRGLGGVWLRDDTSRS